MRRLTLAGFMMVGLLFAVVACGGGGGGGATPPPLPNAPTGLNASVVSPSQINLSWTDTSNDEQGFKIERKTGLNGTYSQIAAVNAGLTNYNDGTITSGNTYFYRIKAYNSGGSSAWSNEVYKTILPTSQTTTATVEVFLLSSAMTKIIATGNSDLIYYGIAVMNTAGTSGASPTLSVPSPFILNEAGIDIRNNDEYFIRWQLTPPIANGRTVNVNQSLFTLTYSIVSGTPTFSIRPNVQGSPTLNVQAGTFLNSSFGTAVAGIDAEDIGISITYQ